MDFDRLLPLLVVLWLLFGWLGRRGRVQRRQDEGIAVERERDADEAAAAAARGRQLQEEMERLFGLPSTGPRRGPLGRQPRIRIPLPEADEGGEEEVEVLEREPEVVSLEAPEGLERERLARGQAEAEEAEVVLRDRLRIAQERLRPRTRADHARFDTQIRAPITAPPPPPSLLRRIPVRQAVIWREVLGPPKGLQKEIAHDP
jgi:hypothetical protein